MALTPIHHPELRTAVDTVGFHAGRRPDHPAIVCQGRTVTWEALHRESNRTARSLAAAGLGAGDRVAYLGKESEHYYELFFACAKAGVVLVPVNWRLAGPEVEYLLRDSGSVLVFAEAEYGPLVEKVTGTLPLRPDVVLVDGGADRGAGLRQWKGDATYANLVFTPGPDDPVVQIYTSGTTGMPKGVVLAHRSFFKVRDALAGAGERWVDWYPEDVSLIAIPGFHVGGLWWAMQGFNAGVTNVAMPMFVSEDAVALIRDLGVTTTCMVPAMLQMALSDSKDHNDFATLRKVTYGGAPIAEPLLKACLDAMGCEFAQFYGLTETGNTTVCLPPEAHVPGSPLMAAAGRPYPGFAAEIVDEDGKALPTGEVGEIRVRTPARMIEYWNLPEATESTLVDGWIHTGDAGYMDADGYVFVCDRIKDTIIVAGENVYPAEIEKAMCEHPAVREAAVVAVPDNRWGETVHAVVVLEPGGEATPREITVFLRERIADFKLPTGYEYMDRLPRNPSGKILRRELREKHWTGLSRRVN
ncbi:long-chain-fatty-acid--CoA ligase [Glycomyces paridis]|uniref:Long-chain-fatty-acid--CoA ligase n=1 Tax=Glycomyces paridis TaxID=2126555 RepID=A0A4S8PFD4_9ACTN|nr:long-chain-fatty-acid--CoA ligase [Glycomyces paridis]THV29138.1 long-chain-fatty-acid--CoA ligase [Glycomyces paridis]